MDFITQLLNGLGLGSIYALIALGYSMVYGIVQLINFAHGDIIMVGGYAIYAVLVMAGMPLWLAILAPIVVCGLAGMLIERLAYQRLLTHNAERISLLITALGVSIFLQNLFQLIFKSDAKTMPEMFGAGVFEFGGLSVTYATLINIVVSVVMMVMLQLLVNKTKVGKAMQATSEDAGAAKLMGINTKNIILLTFAVGSVLAGIGAILYCNTYPQIRPTMGNLLGLKAFVAAVLGGIGSIPGAMLGGYLLGVLEQMTKAYISSEVTDAVVFAILIVVLLVRPAGLMGKYRKEKV
ncbi:MAG TPA: branched-chain amino acid ABC transporter permease [Firmicutes bacterium]|nr:branched-chain amino acid ABC transporter permease [Bacillota bacterium]